MEKQTNTKIILGIIMLVFVVSVFSFSSPIQAADFAQTGVLSDLYSNPNQNNGKNPYKFALSSVLKSGLLQQVVGCTGVVNKVSTWMAGFLQSPKQQAKIAMAETAKIREQLKNACASTKAGAEAAGDSIPTIGGLSKSISTLFAKIKAGLPGGGTVKACQDQVDITSEEMISSAIRQEEQAAEVATKEQCLDGIALTLARNQLTAMTRSAMNWVNNGYGGNPFFVQNMQNFTRGIEQNVVETGINALLSPKVQSPYAADFAKATVASRGLLSSSSGFLGGLQSSLENFITDPQSYYTNNQLNAPQRAQNANDAFARDFSLGGWEGWLALTQIDQNNPLGFTMVANQYIADMETQAVQEKKDELAQNNGFLSQKTCVKWNDAELEELKKNDDFNVGYEEDVCNTNSSDFDEEECLNAIDFTKQGKEEIASFQRKCADDGWKITTPGSIIKDKVTGYLGSPERQLELAKTINDSLNALFSVLISKLEGNGLSGLSDSTENPSNWIDNLNNYTSPDGNTTYDNNGAYDGFNLTKDLGNTYIHDTFTDLGNWNASTNTATLSDKANEVYPKEMNANIKLYPDTAPEIYIVKKDADGNIQYNDMGKKIKEQAYPKNPFYTVTVSGKTALIDEGYNGWAKGDRAFWDGEKWQNWKTGQSNPIKNRGVIQIQNDYIVAAQEILGVLPKVMTNLGELDYCLPGPNPSYQTNSTDAQSAYQDWVGSMYVGPIDANRSGWYMDGVGSTTYNNLASTYDDNPNVWEAIKKSREMNYFDRIFGAGGYHYKPNKKEQEDLDNHQNAMELNLDYTNNALFQNFYDVFNKMMDKYYFSTMTSPYINTETSINTTPNPAYIEMAESGLDLTKNISYYNDDTTKATLDYTDAIAQAKINIAKLNPIKSEVSGIIKVAQDRQIANIITALKKLSGIDSYTPTDAEIAKYRADNKDCLDEENIQVFDPEDITKMGSSDAENCSNGIDDDLNGLVDKNDPACPGYISPDASGLRTSGSNTGGSGFRR